MTDEKATELTVQLTTPIKYATGGDMREADFVVLRAPSSRHKKWCAPLKQAFMQAIMGAESSASPEEKESSETDAVRHDAIAWRIVALGRLR